MLSKSNAAKDVHLFVLAHPDDEIAFAPLLSRLVRQQEEVRLIYLTDGTGLGSAAAVRGSETIAALDQIGLPASSAYFAGSDQHIHDGKLYLELDRALQALEQWSRSWASIADIYSFAWEGGHPDHDAALVVAAAFANSRGLANRVWQAPFYRAPDRLPAPMFTVASPLADNGTVVTIPVTARERRLPAALMRFYPSQLKSFLGLGPFILWRALTARTFGLQRLDLARLRERPTRQPLLYERRNGVRFDEFRAAALPFLQAHLDAGGQRPVGELRASPA
jgi:LmbE family N-acetylglucosaminyl deacetylase